MASEAKFLVRCRMNCPLTQGGRGAGVHERTHALQRDPQHPSTREGIKEVMRR